MVLQSASESFDRGLVRRARNAPRPAAILLSFFFHAIVVGGLLLVSPSPIPMIRNQTVYAQFIAPRQREIIWYRLHDLPVLTTPPNIVRSSDNSGQTKKPDTIINRSADDKQTVQIVLQPELTTPLKSEVSAPKIVAVNATKPSRPAPKIFVPPLQAVEITVSPQIPPAPQISNTPTEVPGVLQSSINSLPRIRRRFVLPAPNANPARATPNVTVPSAPAVNAESASNSNALGKILQQSGQLRVTKPFVPPGAVTPGRKLPAISIPEPDTELTGPVTAAILSLDPSRNLASVLPPEILHGEMSQGPEPGAPASNNARGPSIPGLLVQPAGRKESESGTPAVVEDRESKLSALRTTYSFPLRPSVRTIPRAIEAQFHDRTVYTIIVPKPSLPIYNGDWIIWFAERAPDTGTFPEIRAPLPVRKLAPASGMNQTPSGHVQLMATISRTGEVLSVEWKGSGVPDPAAIRDLLSWEFLPALRNGEPIDVEIIIEMSFR
jgi:hypothetical protein